MWTVQLQTLFRLLNKEEEGLNLVTRGKLKTHAKQL